ncbi:MAG: PDZ domain-containing protein [Acidobacteria bacterium]|nr:PDZ domain-containing protein [Acidobacteriota bacterium]
MAHAGMNLGSAVTRSIGVLALAGVSLFPGGFAAQAQAQSGSIKTGTPRSTQGYLGVDIRDVSDEQLASLKMKEAHGAEVVGVDHDGPACKAGIEVHDVILQVNGQSIEGSEQLRRILRETPAGRQVSFVVSRDGQQRNVNTQMANRDEVERLAWENRYTVPEPDNAPVYAPKRGNSFFHSSPSASGALKGTHSFLGTSMLVSSSYTGAKLEVMGPQLAEFFGAQGSAGLLVRQVDPNSPAADAGMKAGDVVVRLNSQAVVTGSDWTKTIHENRGKQVNVDILRDKKEQTLTLRPDEKKRSSVDAGTGLEEFFGNSDQAEQTRATLAELEPMFDAMAASMRQRLEEVRATPEMTQMMAKLQAWSSNPEFQRQMETAQRQVQAAADATRQRMNSPELQQKMEHLHIQMRDMMQLD